MRRSIVASSVPLLAATLALAACTAAPAARPTPTPSPTSWPVVTWSGEGTLGRPQTHDLHAPAGARSVRLAVSCIGDGNVSVSAPLGIDLLDARYGTCGDLHEWTLPVKAGETTHLDLSAPPGAHYLVEARFDGAPVRIDPAITRDCREFSTIAGLLADADAGVQPEYAAFDAAGWRTRVDDAARRLRADATASSSPLKTLFGVAADQLAAQDIPVGRASTTPAQGAITARCGVNETPLQVEVHYGG